MRFEDLWGFFDEEKCEKVIPRILGEQVQHAGRFASFSLTN
jgi:hypothetical protein